MKKIDWRAVWQIPLVIVLISASVFCSEIEHENGVIIETAQDCIAIKTEDQNIFEFYSNRSYSVGETHEVFFNTRGTEKRTDDEIIIVMP